MPFLTFRTSALDYPRISDPWSSGLWLGTAVRLLTVPRERDGRRTLPITAMRYVPA
jgi:hypothetical protein